MDVERNDREGLSIWLVPPGEGKVRRLRITMTSVLVGTLVLAMVAGGFLYVVGDYGRIQLSRLKNDLWLQMITRERDRLRGSNRQLAEELESLRAAHTHTLAFEKEARERLDSIAGIIKSSTPLALNFKKGGEVKVVAEAGPNASDKRLASKVSKGGVGGSEVECARGLSTDECIRAAEEASVRAQLSFDPKLLKRTAFTSTQGDLLGVLDEYVKLLTALPLSSPSNGEKTSGFGVRISPFHLGMRVHEGVDYSAPIGTPIYVTADGVIDTVNLNDTYGLHIDVRHGDKILTRYAHLSHASVRVGQKVTRGQIIGNVGSTGRSTGPHLHYEVRVDGIPKNPEAFNSLGEKLAKVAL